ncbi:MAG: hypothetical protein JW904_12815 [Spirochaetales bacterium]|nr:hypothetical protein [Spirochaetales bacterium]
MIKYFLIYFLLASAALFSQSNNTDTFREQMLFIVHTGENTPELAKLKELSYAITRELASRKNIVLMYSQAAYNLEKPEIGFFSELAYKKYCHSTVLVTKIKSQYYLVFHDIKNRHRYSLLLAESLIPSSEFRPMINELSANLPALPQDIMEDAEIAVLIGENTLLDLKFTREMNKKIFTISAGAGGRLLLAPDGAAQLSSFTLETILFWHYNSFLCSGIGYARTVGDTGSGYWERIFSPSDEIIIIPLSIRAGNRIIAAMDIWTGFAPAYISDPGSFASASGVTIFFRTGFNLHAILYFENFMAMDFTIGRLLFAFHPESPDTGKTQSISIDLFTMAFVLRF